MSRWNAREAHGGEIADEVREAWARLEADRASFPALPATSRLDVCVCTKLYGSEPCVPDMTALPAHSTCGTITDENGERVGGMCWCWTGCDDPDCDHPACEGKGWRDFAREYPQDRASTTIVVWTSPWEPWEETGRHPTLLAEWRDGKHRVAKEPKPDRVLRALEGGKPVDSLRVGGPDYLAVELALVDGGLALEHRWCCTTTEDHLAYAICKGGTIDGLGGTITGQIRLATALDLADAPIGYQGALFA